MQSIRRIGVIDLGSNSARLVLVDVYPSGGFHVIDELKESVRLAQDMDDDGRLLPRRIRQTIQTLLMFKRLCEANGVTEIIAVATAAVRRARNQRSFLDELTHATGLELRVLTEEEECFYIHQAVINSFDYPDGLIVDIGGGSVELILMERKQMKEWITLPYGAVTLTDRFDLRDKVSAEQLGALQAFLREELERIPWLQRAEGMRLIGVGGSFRNLGKIARRRSRYPLDIAHNYTMEAEDAKLVHESLLRMDLGKRMRIPGLSNERADIFLAASTIGNAITELCHVSQVVISGAGLREGIIFQQVIPRPKDKPIDDVLEYSLTAITERLSFNVEHCRRVYQLSQCMFDQLRSLHKLPASMRRVLKAAAMLHDCGGVVSYYNHQRHACYLILNSNIYGLTHRELAIAAFVASGHRRDELRKDWSRYAGVLQENDGDIILKLGVLVRIAECFDRSMSGIIDEVPCDILGDSVIMKTQGNGEPALEIKDALTAGPMFKRAYGKNLVIL